MRLSEREKQVIAAIEFNADIPLTLLAKNTKIPLSALRYGLDSLLEKGALRYYPFINSNALGYQQYSVFFSFVDGQRGIKEKAIEYLLKSKQVSWLAELGGNYQYCMSLLCKSPDECKIYLDNFCKIVGSIFGRRQINTQIYLTMFQTKYIHSKRHPKDFLKWGEVPEKFTLDSTDNKILSVLVNETYTSRRDVARILGMPIATLDSRIRRLQDRKIIVRFVYIVNPVSFHMLTFKLLVFTKGVTEELDNAIFQFCLEHPNITSLIRTMGSWDYELGVEVHEARELLGISQQISDRFGNIVLQVEQLSQFSELKISCFPFLEERYL